MQPRAIALLLGVSLLAAAPLFASHSPTERRVGRLAVPFIANQGQSDSRIAFSASMFAGTVFVTREGEIVHSLPAREGPGWSLTETLVGGTTRPVGQEPSATRVSSFLGSDPSCWRSALPTYGSVGLGEVWKGIEVSLLARGAEVEKLFTVAPGASARTIRVRVAGAKKLRIDPNGRLLAKTGRRDVAFSAPVAYQERSGERSPIAVAYVARGNEYGFRLGAYDSALPVVIDPLLQATYLGGSEPDEASAIAVHPTTGEVYVAGSTMTGNFPGTAGGAQPIFGAGVDGFVARFNPSLTALLQATYLGGFFAEGVRAVAIHPASGEVYVAGFTDSGNFPGTAGGAQPSFGGGSPGSSHDAFVAHLNPSLTVLSQATYLGGDGNELANTIAFHSSGEVYVAGETSSTNLPSTAGAEQAAYGGGDSDGFVARLNTSLTAFVRVAYLGGSETDRVTSLAAQAPGDDVYVAGMTTSANFPDTPGGAQTTLGGVADAFVARLNSSLASLVQASYLGGSNGDSAAALIRYPPSGEVFVAGSTSSSDFPGTAFGAQAAFGGGLQDAFVARLDATLTTLAQATYLGGSDSDSALALSNHPLDEVYVGGITSSSNLPGTTYGAQAGFGGLQDAFVARFGNLAAIGAATYIGGSGTETAVALGFSAATGDIYVAGGTGSTNLPGTGGGAQTAYGGGLLDAFVAQFTWDLIASVVFASFYTLTPCRVADTREPAGPWGGPALAANSERTFQVGGSCGMPFTARAVALNITVVGPTDVGDLRLRPADIPLQPASTINFRAGQVRANNAIVALSRSGEMTVRLVMPGAGSAHLLLDVSGYFE